MPLFSKSNKGLQSDSPDIREVEKRVAKEARADQKSLDSALDDFSKAGKVHDKSVQGVEKARHDLDKAVQTEHKAAQALDRATQKHNVAVTNAQNAEKTVQVQNDQSSRLEQDLEQKRQRLEQLRQHKTHNDQLRESKLSEIHAREAAAADARSSFDAGRRASVGSVTAPDTARHATGAAGTTPRA